MKVSCKYFRWLFKNSEFILPTILCTFGFLVQFCILLKEFRQREIMFDYKLEFNESVTVPHVTICSKVSSLVNLDQLNRDKLKLFTKKCYGPLSQKCLEEKSAQDEFHEIVLRNFDMDGITRYLPKGDKIIKKLEIDEFTENLLGKNCSIIDHLLFPEFCYTIVCRDGNQSIIQWRGNFGLHLSQQMIKIRVNTMNLRGAYFRVMIHPSEEDPLVTPGTAGVRIPSIKRGLSFHEISYRRTFLERLPPPFETKCQDVLVSKILDDCLNDGFIRNFNIPCPIRFIAPEKYLGKHLNITMKRGLGKDGAKYLRIFGRCLQNLPNECKSTSYDLQLYSSAHYDDKKNQEMTVYIMTPMEQDIVMFATPKLPCSRFLISLGSIFGSWFGFSVFNIASQLMSTAKGLIKDHRIDRVRKFSHSTRRIDNLCQKKNRRLQSFVRDCEISRFMYM